MVEGEIQFPSKIEYFAGVAGDAVGRTVSRVRFSRRDFKKLG